MKYNFILETIANQKITKIVTDSRKANKDSIFFAIQGINNHGNLFLADVLNKDVKVIVTDQQIEASQLENFSQHCEIIYVDDSKQALAFVCSKFYSKIPRKLIAVTGTSGKTSVVSYIAQILQFLNIPAATVGTMGVVFNSVVKNRQSITVNSELNTQELVDFYEILTIIKDRGIDIVAFEASSHGLAQGRLDGIAVDYVGFVSFSQDHLDFHNTMAEYFQAKLQIFSNNLKDDGKAVINNDMSCTNTLISALNSFNKSFISVGRAGDLVIKKIDSTIAIQKVEFNYQNAEYKFATAIIGNFQIYNILIASCLVSLLEFNFQDIVNCLDKLMPVTGRLEKLATSRHIFIDYAHKPEALEFTLTTLARIKQNDAKLIVIFGCGGDRDKSKRPIMGDIACKFADIIIITDDNPRLESPNNIRQEILAGTISHQLKGHVVKEIGDRREAIKDAISMMQENDILLVAGKGHETYQLIAQQKKYFSDKETVLEIIQGK